MGRPEPDSPSCEGLKVGQTWADGMDVCMADGVGDRPHHQESQGLVENAVMESFPPSF